MYHRYINIIVYIFLLTISEKCVSKFLKAKLFSFCSYFHETWQTWPSCQPTLPYYHKVFPKYRFSKLNCSFLGLIMSSYLLNNETEPFDIRLPPTVEMSWKLFIKRAVNLGTVIARIKYARVEWSYPFSTFFPLSLLVSLVIFTCFHLLKRATTVFTEKLLPLLCSSFLPEKCVMLSQAKLNVLCE